MTGIVDKYNDRFGFGFIRPLLGKPDEVSDVYFHASSIRMEGRGRVTIPIGIEVDFDLARGRKGPQAVNVRPRLLGTEVLLKGDTCKQAQ